MNKFNFKDDWDNIPDRGILPEQIKMRMWNNIRKPTLNTTNFYVKKIVAACILIFVGAATYYAVFESDAYVKQELAYLETYEGSVQFLRLPDGSRVWVNENTKLKYPKEFNTNNRTVILEGEAYFDIKKDDNKPFIIKSNQTTTITLEASFQLNTRESQQKVWVTKGAVKVGGIILNSGYTGVYKLDTNSMFKEKVAFNEPNWKQSIIDVEGHTLFETLELLKKDYQFNVLYKQDNIKNIRLRGTLIKQPLDSMLTTLSYALKLKITPTTEVNNIYMITSK